MTEIFRITLSVNGKAIPTYPRLYERKKPSGVIPGLAGIERNLDYLRSRWGADLELKIERLQGVWEKW
jgi:hypothetical protein